VPKNPEGTFEAIETAFEGFETLSESSDTPSHALKALFETLIRLIWNLKGLGLAERSGYPGSAERFDSTYARIQPQGVREAGG